MSEEDEQLKAFGEKVAAEMRAAGWDGEPWEVEVIEEEDGAATLIIEW